MAEQLFRKQYTDLSRSTGDIVLNGDMYFKDFLLYIYIYEET